MPQKQYLKLKNFHNSWALKKWMKNGCYPKISATYGCLLPDAV